MILELVHVVLEESLDEDDDAGFIHGTEAVIPWNHELTDPAKSAPSIKHFLPKLWMEGFVSRLPSK